jgi:hypothetical protein
VPEIRLADRSPSSHTAIAGDVPFVTVLCRFSDIGAYYGGQYTDFGDGLAAAGQGPGTYDVAVFPHSVVTGKFAGARVVRVTVE